MKRLLSISLTLLVLALSASGQKKRAENLPNFDRRMFHFGFIIGFNSAHMELQRNAPTGPLDSLHVISVDPQAGFNLGIVSSMKLAPLLKLRFVPSLSFAQRNLDYYYKLSDNSWENVTKTIESTYVEFPLMLKFKSKRLNNFGVYVIGGGKFAIDLIADQDVDNMNKPDEDIVIKLQRNTFQAEVGAGTDFYLEYFKFGIELKMSYTLTNTLVQDNTVYSSAIQGLYPRIFLISFTFEG